MISVSKDAENFLEVVAKVAATAAESTESLNELREPLESAGLLDLALDTAGEPDALAWLCHTVRVAAGSTPSLAFALAARYAADRLRATGDAGGEATFGLLMDPPAAAVPMVFNPDVIVALHVESNTVMSIPIADLEIVIEPRTGLKRSRIGTVKVPDAVRASAPARDGATLAEWDLLSGAVLIGIGRRAADTAANYVLERRQFGVPIASFAGLRALVAELELRIATVEAAFDRALQSGGGPADGISATAGVAVIDTCVDAIQALGGYGYIDEYPVSGLLRDAISVQARAGGRRLHMSRIASRVLGAREVGLS